MIDNKVLVSISIPSLEVKYDVYVPVNRKVYSVINMLKISLFEISLGLFDITKDYVLYNAVNGTMYDMNALVNRHISNNLRILLINNGGGTEFNLYFHYAKRICSDVNRYIAASGHNGNKSEELVKHYVTDLGFDYLKADDKESFIRNLGVFLSQKPDGKSILFEVFTNHNDESEAVRIIRNL